MNRNKIIVKDKNGFTIVELLVVIAIIGILSTIGVLSYFRIQASTRDSQRSTKMTILAEALEKYFDKNGEYPSCYAITQAPSTVSTTTLSGLDPTVLKTPSAADGTNSILPLCADLPAETDAIAYIGDGSVACTSISSPKACLEWTLKYREEATGNIISVTSRRNIAASNAGNISDLSVSSTSFVQAGLTWAAIGSATNYYIQKATNSDFTINMTESTAASNTATVAGLSMNTKYYFRVRAIFTSGSGNWSNVANTTTLNITAPIATATANSTSQITINWNAITNATSYNIDMSTSPTFTSPTSITGIVATSRAFSGLSSGIKYYFRVQSAALSFTSTWSTTVSATTTISAPATPTVTAVNNSTTSTWSWNAAACAAGTTARYYYIYTISPSGYNSGSVVTSGISVSFTTSTRGQTYTVQVQSQCYTASTTSSLSGVGSASYYRIPTLWVAVGSTPNNITTSPDGINWTGRGITVFSNGGGYGVAWNGSLWVAVGNGTNAIATSPDGINWTGRGTAMFSYSYPIGYDVAWNGSLWVAVGGGDVNTNSIATSPDGINWTGRGGTSIFNGVGGGRGVAWNGSMWVAVGNGSSGHNSIATSTDGINWTGRGTAMFPVGYGVAWNGSMWVAVGNGTNAIATSPDGINWTGRGNPILPNGEDVIWNGSMWVAVSYAGTNFIATSPDGINWTGRGNAMFGGSGGAGHGIAWDGNLFVAVGTNTYSDSITTSPDGINWTGRGGTAMFYTGHGVTSNYAPNLYPPQNN